MKVKKGSETILEQQVVVEAWSIASEGEVVAEAPAVHVESVRPSYLRLTWHHTILVIVIWIHGLADISLYWQSCLQLGCCKNWLDIWSREGRTKVKVGCDTEVVSSQLTIVRGCAALNYTPLHRRHRPSLLSTK